eukprot:gb/GFBE01025624.1/.p1 GENE.gb/GFBE01025624.1/~~gb/GFBE01025624.1/.p1  ORF type:complete len:615 (+),score=211.26 gb/GFBE01025624.1/:1-1845(+)
MKVQVNIEFVSDSKLGVKNGNVTSLNLAVKQFDTVQSLKQRVAIVEPIPFPNQDLQLDDKTLDDNQRFGDLGIQDGQTLRLLVRASEKIFVDQLSELLKARPLSTAELGLLYCHQHGATVAQALTALNSEEQLPDFLHRQKCFTAEEGGLISLCQEKDTDTIDKSLTVIREQKDEHQAEKDLPLFPVNVSVTVKTQSGNVEEATLSLKVTKAHTLRGVCERALEAECIPFDEQEVVFQGKKLELDQQLGACGVSEGAFLHVEVLASQDALVQQLAKLLKGRALSVVELSDKYCYRFGTPVSRALKLLGLRGQLKEFLKANAEVFSIMSGCVTLLEGAPLSPKPASAGLNQRYLELDAEISSCASIQKANDALDMAIQAASEGSFSVARAIRGGSVGRGTAIKGSSDAKALLVVQGMPSVGREKWLPSLLIALSALLRQQLGGEAEDISVNGDAVDILFKGNVFVQLTMDAVSGAEALRAERTARFFDKQTMPAKITMRLLKWWRNQQSWSNEQSRPSDLLLELLAAHAATCAAPATDQVQAVDKVLALMANFGKLEATWPGEVRSYRKEDVAEEMMQRPLLLDPVDPTVNHAAGEAFDHQQLASLAAKAKGAIL